MRKDNKGFTLVELLLSIVILAILILPALSGFTSAAKINKKASDIQVATDLAQNIMESVKNYNLEDNAMQFYGKGSLFLSSNYNVASYASGGYGEYLYNNSLGSYNRVTAADVGKSVAVTVNGSSTEYKFLANKDTYHFGIKNVVTDDGAHYDAMITLDTSNYNDDGDTLNNYPIPDLLELDQTSVAVIDPVGMTTNWSNDTDSAVVTSQHSTDDEAVGDFINSNQSYVSSKASEHDTNPSVVVPAAFSESDIINNTQKTININISKDAVNNKVKVTCKITYYCTLNINGDASGFTLPVIDICSGSYPIPSKEEVQSNIYLFYTPSKFTDKDTITINNSDVKANVYIVNQNSAAVSRVTINKTDTPPDANTNILTNLIYVTTSSIVKNSIYNTQLKKNRVYQIKVSVYPAGTLENPDKPFVTLSSTREEDK